MIRRIHVRRYAQAAFELALERKELDRWQSDLKKIASLAEDATIVAFLESPKIHFESKVKLLSEQLGDINPLALNLAYLLVKRGGFCWAGEIDDEFQCLSDSYRGIEQAEVITAIPLDKEDEQRLTERLGTVVGKKVVIKPKLDASIIGGIIARIGDKLIDGSTRSRLLALKSEIVSTGR